MNINDKMQSLAWARAEKLTPRVLDEFPSLTQIKTTTWIGTYSWSNQAEHRRFIDAGVLVDLFGVPQVPPEVARDYLRAKYTERRRHTVDQYAAINEHRAAPLYAKVGVYSDMALVDLKAAYWSIVQAVGWDVDYCPSRWLGKRSDNDDFPLPDNKIARNSLVSAGLLVPTHLWDGEGLIQLKAHNPYVNYSLWACVQDVLHAIATIALKAGAVHIHTDGYIVPAKRADALIGEIAKFGLRASQKTSGDAAIKGVGSYMIGDRRTKKQYHFSARTFSSVYEPDIPFLRPRVRALATRHIDWSIHDDETA